MMYSDRSLVSKMEDYLQAHTTPPPAIVKNLIQATKTETALPNMLSGPVEGRFLSMLVKMLNAKRVLEIGTFTGFSALMMAEGLSADGILTTYEVRPEHAQIAQRYFDQSPHGHKIKLKLGNALQMLEDDHQVYDFAFIDADKKNYPNYYELAVTKLRSGGMIAVDNALWGGEVLNPTDDSTRAIAETNRFAREDKRVETVLLPIRDGILLVRKI